MAHAIVLKQKEEEEEEKEELSYKRIETRKLTFYRAKPFKTNFLYVYIKLIHTHTNMYIGGESQKLLLCFFELLPMRERGKRYSNGNLFSSGFIIRRYYTLVYNK